MNKYVLDSSALLAVAYDERGADRVKPIFNRSVMSSVSLSECIGKMASRGIPAEDALTVLTDMVPDIIDFDQTIALIAGGLVPNTQPLGLSLGDRACLATGIRLRLEVVTADKIWGKLKLPVKVMLIR